MPGESVITFDFYGTLVQWHETLEIAFREMLVRRGLPGLGIALDAVVTAQQARTYKPDLRLFRRAHTMLA